MSLKRAIEAIRRNKRFLITAHTSLEGDALGSEIAFYYLIKKLGKCAVIVNQDAVPANCSFLPFANNIKHLDRKTKNIDFDCMVYLDCADLRRAGDIYKLNVKNKPVINIDHHVSNNKFAQVNWVDAKCSSASEMVYKLYKEMGVSIDKKVAVCLYTGILSDTGSFRYTNTASHTHLAAAELMSCGIDTADIYRKVYADIPYVDMKFLSKILPTIKRECHGQVAYCLLHASLLKKQKRITFDLSENILSFARAIRGIKVVVLFKENLGLRREVRVNFRSHGAVDVNKIARSFSGGGHKTAAGCTIGGSLDSVKKRVLKKVRESLK